MIIDICGGLSSGTMKNCKFEEKIEEIEIFVYFHKIFIIAIRLNGLVLC